MTRRTTTDEQLIAAYRKTGSSYKAGGLLGVSDSTVRRALERNNIERCGEGFVRGLGIRLGRGFAQRVRAEHEAGATVHAIAKANNTGWDVVANAIRRVGGDVKQAVTPRNADEVEKILSLFNQGLRTTAIAQEIGRSESFVRRLLGDRGIRTSARGSGHYAWAGGRYVGWDGYVMVIVPPDSPFASMRRQSGYVFEHRLEMAKKLGRPLSRTESVHHIDGDRGNNDPSNLQLRQGQHGSHIVLVCARCGSEDLKPGPIADAHRADAFIDFGTPIDVVASVY